MGILRHRIGRKRYVESVSESLRIADIGLNDVIADVSTPLFAESFADSNFASRGWYSIVSQDWVASPAPVGFSGSLRMTWNTGQTVPSSGGMRRLFTPTDHIRIRYQQAFSANWVGSGQSYHPHFVMLLSELDDAYAGPSDSYLAFYSEINYQSGNRAGVHFQDNQYIDPTPANLYPNQSTLEARSTSGANGRQGYADSWDFYQDAGFSNGYSASRNLTSGVLMAPGDTSWHTVEVEVILNSIVGGVSQLDGICRYWWDGVLIFERTNLIMRTATRPNLRFNQFLLAPYIGDGSPVTQSMYISDLSVSATTAVVDPVIFVTATGTMFSSTTEADIVSGGRTIILTLTGATWNVAGTPFDGQRRNIINGIVSSSNEATWWNALRTATNIPNSSVVRTSDTVVTITIPAIAAYNITFDEVLSITVPSTAQSAGTALIAGQLATITAAPAAPSAVITGTAAGGWFESEVVSGGDTLILTLSADTWIASGTSFDAQRQAIINGIVAATSPTNGWNAVRSSIPVTSVVRTSATVVTITIPALASYSVTANETLTVTIPASAVVGNNAIVATPTIVITEGAPVTGWLANKPSTYNNVLSDYPFSSVIPVGGDTPIGDGSIWNQVFNSGGTRRVVDATAPISPSYVLEHYYPVGHTHGTGVGQLYASLSTSQLDFYVCMMCKWSSNYEWNPVSNKFLIWDPGHLIVESRHYAGQYLTFEPQDVTNPGFYTCNVATPTIPLDQWVQIEVLLHRSATNGSIKIWMDNVLYMDRSGIDTGVPSGWHEISINSTWGGTSDPTSRESWNWIDHIYLAVP